MVTNKSEMQDVLSVIEEKMSKHTVLINRIERLLPSLFHVIITMEDGSVDEHGYNYGTYSVDTNARTVTKL